MTTFWNTPVFCEVRAMAMVRITGIIISCGQIGKIQHGHQTMVFNEIDVPPALDS